MEKFFLIILFAFLGTNVHAQQSIYDSQREREQVEVHYELRKNEVPYLRQLQTLLSFDRAINGGKSVTDQNYIDAETDALHFLYAYMPLADITDYSLYYYRDNVRQSLKAREELPWGNRVPNLLFRHFVLPPRVNNENLDTFRVACYDELKQRVSGLNMKDAILEVNHWCHEHVTYHPSDARTLSPLSTMRNTLGRCGEESTFTVAALRTLGIPARQVYTPRWAHTDDNHAWVEAWADGEWFFLGACEPEAVLNLGWFNAPASRAMLMHTRAFGNYNGNEEVVLRARNFTEINLIDNYAQTARVDFRVITPEGQPVENARVEFKIYNYAEFYTAVTKYTDKDGCTFLTAGLGDLLVWASKDGHYGYQKASFGKDSVVTVVLSRGAESSLANAVLQDEPQEMDIVPPVGKNNIPAVAPEQQEYNRMRLAKEDSLRMEYARNTFYQGSSQTPLAPFLKKAKANWHTIETFYNLHPADTVRTMGILQRLSEKDMTDISLFVLEDTYLSDSRQLDIRVEDEPLLFPFKHSLARQFNKRQIKRFRSNPDLLMEWVDTHIQVDNDPTAQRIAQSPFYVAQTKQTDPRSRDIFFVSLARSLDIPAYKDPVTGKIVYGTHEPSSHTAQPSAETTGQLQLDFTPTRYVDDAKYYSHFTISKIEDGSLHLLTYDEGELDMGGGTSWSNTFKPGVELATGDYLLTSGTRLANGSVLAKLQHFSIEQGTTTTVPLSLRTSDTEVSVIGSFDSESKYLSGSQEVSILSQTGRGYFVVGIVAMGQEPTKHALRDIAKVSDELNAWGRPLILLFENTEELAKFSADDYGQLPEHTLMGIDADGSIRRQIAAQMKLQGNDTLPLFIIADTFNRVVFSSEGYTIGLGEQLLKTMRGIR